MHVFHDLSQLEVTIDTRVHWDGRSPRKLLRSDTERGILLCKKNNVTDIIIFCFYCNL